MVVILTTLFYRDYEKNFLYPSHYIFNSRTKFCGFFHKCSDRISYRNSNTVRFALREQSGYEHPAELAQDITPYIKFAGSRQEVFRNFIGEHKKIDHGLFSIGLNYPLIENTAGTYISFTENRSSISWPFSKNRVRTVDSYKAGTMCVSGYASAYEHLRAGATIGKQLESDRDGLLYIAEFSGAISQRLNGSL